MATREQCEKRRNFATDLTTKGVKRLTVNIDTLLKGAEAPPMESLIAMLPLGIEMAGKQPKYLRYHIWDPDGTV
jgi:hypothetical protein